ncbi:MAG: hypothetical protein ACPLY7_00960 [Microgenomates group bacterium]
MATQKTSFKEKSLSAVLMFVIGFVGTSFLGAIVLLVLIALGIVPRI